MINLCGRLFYYCQLRKPRYLTQESDRWGGACLKNEEPLAEFGRAHEGLALAALVHVAAVVAVDLPDINLGCVRDWGGAGGRAGR